MGLNLKDARLLADRVWSGLFNDRDVALADELFAVEYRNHAGGDFSGPAGMRRLIEELTVSFPDHRTVLEDLVADGDTVAMRVTFSGTHQGPFRGFPPTNRSFEQAQMHWVCVDDAGRIIDHWAVRDDLGMLMQLGLMPGGGPRDQ